MMDVSLDNYKLSCELLGHNMDVRSVSATGNASGDQMIVSGSRDKVAKVWKRDGNDYIELAALQDHNNFISCVFYLESEQWICTGSNDSTVCIYQEGSYKIVYQLKGHGSNVCSIACGVEPKSLITGSWDKTARIWTVGSMGYTSISLNGHEAAVWAVASMPSVKKFITGSADKMIFYWNAKGDKLRIVQGHTDCVRGIFSLNSSSLVSCANDATIRYWNEDGECIKVLNGHTNYIYDIGPNKALGEEFVVSCGEDSTLRMWNIVNGTELGAPIVHPAQSVWSVTCLKNGDIVTGASDGVIRVFTKEVERVANEAALNVFQLAVTAWEQQLNEKLGDIKKTDLPGPEFLLKNGFNEQTVMIRHPDGSVKCYKWQLSKWNLIGDVTGASTMSPSSSKKLHEGKEYDFVFSVDISDTEAPIKLPYNIGDDPWQSAQSFIHRHNLPQTYLDQIANFVINNSGSDVKLHNTMSGYQDPFTGGSRYVPCSNNMSLNHTGNIETGGSGYSTTAAIQESKFDVNSAKGSSKHFPISQYVTFDHCDPSKILDKLKEFNNKLPNSNAQVSDTLLEAVIKLIDKTPEIEKHAIEAMQHLLHWPSDILFPVLDVARLAIRNESLFTILNSFNFLQIVIPKITASGPNQLMMVRCLANMMCHEAGRHEVNIRIVELLELIIAIKSGSSNLQIAISTFYLNLTLSQTLGVASADNCRKYTEGIIEFLKWAFDLEACYRTMQAIGNLSATPFRQETAAQVISVDCVMNRIRELTYSPQTGSYAKLNGAGTALLTLFKNI